MYTALGSMLLYVMDLSYKVYFVPPVALAQMD